MNRIVLALEVIAVFSLCGFLYWAAWVWPVLPFGSRLFTTLAMFLPVVSLLALIGVTVSVTAVLRGRSRSGTNRTLAWSLAVVAATAVGLWFGPSHRMQRIARVTEEAALLVRAIDEFERREHRPPERLGELVPAYLPAIPSTGMGGYPSWEYRTGSDALTYSQNRWVLFVDTGGPGINFDQLMYLPNQQYRELGRGGRIERVGRWAYVYE